MRLLEHQHLAAVEPDRFNQDGEGLFRDRDGATHSRYPHER